MTQRKRIARVRLVAVDPDSDSELILPAVADALQPAIFVGAAQTFDSETDRCPLENIDDEASEAATQKVAETLNEKERLLETLSPRSELPTTTSDTPVTDDLRQQIERRRKSAEVQQLLAGIAGLTKAMSYKGYYGIKVLVTLFGEVLRSIEDAVGGESDR